MRDRSELPRPGPDIWSKRVLVLEDVAVLAMAMEDLLLSGGYMPLKAARVSKALELAAHEPFCAAILDVKVAGDASWPVARELGRGGTPFMFVTGYSPVGMPGEFADVTTLQKPFRPQHLLRALDELCRHTPQPRHCGNSDRVLAQHDRG